MIVIEYDISTVDYLACLLFLPPTSYSELTTQQMQSFKSWSLHGIYWDRGNYPIFILPNQFKAFSWGIGVQYSTLGEKRMLTFLAELLEFSTIDLNSIECPLISVNYFTQNCRNHYKRQKQFQKHCSKEKAIFYFNWLTKERGIDGYIQTRPTSSGTFCSWFSYLEMLSKDFASVWTMLSTGFLKLF